MIGQCLLLKAHKAFKRTTIFKPQGIGILTFEYPLRTPKICLGKNFFLQNYKSVKLITPKHCKEKFLQLNL